MKGYGEWDCGELRARRGGTVELEANMAMAQAMNRWCRQGIREDVHDRSSCST